MASAPATTPGANPFKGLSTAVANARLSRAIRSVLADNERRIDSELQVDLPRAIWNQATTPQHLTILLCCTALVAAYAHGVDAAGGPATEQSIIFCAALFVVNVGLNVGLACVRLRQLSWEVHSRVATTVLEFERACGLFRPAVPADRPTPAPAPPLQPAAVLVDGIVVQTGAAWRPLDFHDPAKTMHTVPVYRDGDWVRLPVLLLVRGDLIALMSGEPAPAKGRCVDAGGAGRRSSMTAVYRMAAARAAGNGGTGDAEALPPLRRARASSNRHGGEKDLPGLAQPLPAPGGRGDGTGDEAGASTGQQVPTRRRGAHSATPGSRRGGGDLASGMARQRNVEVLTLCGDMRRYCLDDTPAAVALRKRLRTPHRPQPLFLAQLRSLGRLGLWWQAAVCVLAVTAVIVRSALTPSAAPDASVPRNVPGGAGRPVVGVLAGVLLQLPTALLCASPLSFTALQAAAELVCTASVLAAYELALLRSRWKTWKKALTLRVLARERSHTRTRHEHGSGAADGALETTRGTHRGGRSRWNPLSRTAVYAHARGTEHDAEAIGAAAALPYTPGWARRLLSWLRVLPAERVIADESRQAIEASDSGVPGSAAAEETPLFPFILEGDAAVAGSGDPYVADAPLSVDSSRLLLRSVGAKHPSSARNASSDAMRAAAERRIMLAGGREGHLAAQLLDAVQASPGGSLDIGGITLHGELVPAAYARLERAGEPLLLVDDVVVADSGTVRAGGGGSRETFLRQIGALVHWLCCWRRHAPLLQRRFEGPTFSQISAHWQGPPASRTWYYAGRLLLTPLTRLVGSSAARGGISLTRQQLDLAAHEQQRWANESLRDALVDVGFGLQPVATPMASAQLLLRLGSATVFCCADRSTVAEPDPVVENVMLLKGEKGSAIVDLHADDTSPTGVRFDQPHWKRHLQSLKPVGLACMLNATELSSASESAPFKTVAPSTEAAGVGHPPAGPLPPEASPPAEARKSKRKSRRLKSATVDSTRGPAAFAMTAAPASDASASAGSRLRQLVPRMLQRAVKAIDAPPSAPSVSGDAALAPAVDASSGETLPPSAQAGAALLPPSLLSPRAGSVLSQMVLSAAADSERAGMHGTDTCDALLPLPLLQHLQSIESESAVASKPPLASRLRMQFLSVRGASPLSSSAGAAGGSQLAIWSPSLLAPSPGRHALLLQQRSLPATPTTNSGTSETVPATLRVSFRTDAESIASSAGEGPLLESSAVKRPFSLSRMLPSSLRQSLGSRRWGGSVVGRSVVEGRQSPLVQGLLSTAPSPAAVTPAPDSGPNAYVGIGGQEQPPVLDSSIPVENNARGASASSSSDDADNLSEYSFEKDDDDDDEDDDNDSSENAKGATVSEDSDDSEASGESDASESSIDSVRYARRQKRQARLARRIPAEAGDARSSSLSVGSEEETSDVPPLPRSAQSTADTRKKERPRSDDAGLPDTAATSAVERMLPSGSPRDRRRSVDASDLYQAALRGSIKTATPRFDETVRSTGSFLRHHSVLAGDLLVTTALTKSDGWAAGSGTAKKTDRPRVVTEGHAKETVKPNSLQQQRRLYCAATAITVESPIGALSPRSEAEPRLSRALLMNDPLTGPMDDFVNLNLGDSTAHDGDDSESAAQQYSGGGAGVVAIPRSRGDEQWTVSPAVVASDLNLNALAESGDGSHEVGTLDAKSARKPVHGSTDRAPDSAGLAVFSKKVRHREVMPFVDVDALIQVRLSRLAAEDDKSLRKLVTALRGVPPRSWLKNLATEMGFTDHDSSFFSHVRHIYTIVSGGSSASGATTSGRFASSAAASQAGVVSSSPRRLLQHVHDTPWLKPALQATVVSDTRNGRLQMLTQGALPFILANCSDYWDGSTLFPLTPARRATLLQTYQQMRAEDLSCTAIAYDPVSNQEAALFKLLDSAVPPAPVVPSTPADVASAPPASPTLITTSDVGLGFDDRRVYLLAREGDTRLNAQVDARTNTRHQDHLFSKLQSLLASTGVGSGSSTTRSRQEVSPTEGASRAGEPGEAQPASLATLVEARLMRMLSGQIFVGLVAARVQPKPKMQNTIKDLDRSGIRFVFMSNRSYRKTKPLATKMGLETGWNCAISLMPRKRSAGRTGASSAAGAENRSPVPDRNELGEFGAEDDEEDYGVVSASGEGVFSDEKRTRMLKSTMQEETWDAKAQLPHGIPAIRTHLRDVDNVPLLVSLFTDSTPPAIAGMLRIMQENGEQVVVLSAALRKSSPLLFAVGDVGIALAPHPRLTTTSQAIHAITALTPEDALLQGLVPRWVVPRRTITRATGLATLPTIAAPQRQLTPAVHPQLSLATSLASLHCAFVLPGDAPPHLLLRLLSEARRGCDATRQSLSFAAAAQLSLALLVVTDIATALPPVLPLYYLLFFVWVVVPAIALPLLAAPPDPLHMTASRTPLKRTEAGAQLWDILDAPTAATEPITQHESVHRRPSGAAPSPIDGAGVAAPLDGAGGGAAAAAAAAAAAGTAADVHCECGESFSAHAPECNVPDAEGACVLHVGGGHELASPARPASSLAGGGANTFADAATDALNRDAEMSLFDGVDSGGGGGDDERAQPLVYIGDAEGDEEVFVHIPTVLPVPPAPSSPASPTSANSARMQPFSPAPAAVAAKVDAAVLAEQPEAPLGEPLAPIGSVRCSSATVPAGAAGALGEGTVGIVGASASSSSPAAAALVVVAAAASAAEAGGEVASGSGVTAGASAPDTSPPEPGTDAPPSSSLVTRGATAFNPVTGGVHAEGLIRYGQHCDAFGVLAGHSVDLSSASAQRLVTMLRKGSAILGGSGSSRRSSRGVSHPPGGSGSGGSFKRAAPLSSTSAAAAAASISMGIAPAQGLLATPPPPAVPASWARLTAYVLAFGLPCAVFHEYLYARLLVAGLSADGLLPEGPAWGRYPLVDPAGAPDVGVAQALDARVAWAQALVFFSFTLWLAGASSHFMYRSLPWWRANPLRCRAWIAGCAAAIALEVAFGHACTAAAGAPSFFVGVPYDAWVAVALFQLAALVLVGLVKRHDGRLYERMMTSLRLYFDTRLGMYSPR